MQISFKPTRQNKSAYALLIVMSFLAASLLVFGSVMYWISSNAHVTAMNNQFNMSEAAAEAATEKVLSQMNYDYVAQSLTNSGAYYGSTFIPGLTTDQATWPIQYIYSATNGETGKISVDMGPWTTNTVPLNSQYTGLYGLEQTCTITATATPIGQGFTVPATISEAIQFASIPLFQFAIFYNMDLEFCAAQTLLITGPVWSNGGIWSGSTTITFQNAVSAVGIATNTANDPFCPGYTGSGKSTYSMAGQPTSGNDRITMPIGTNNDPVAVEAIINLPPADYALGSAAAFSTNGQIYLANGCDLYLTNSPYGTNWGSLRPNCINTNFFANNANMILYYQDANTPGAPPYQTRLPYDFFILKTIGTNGPPSYTTNYVSTNLAAKIDCVTNVQYAGYSFVSNVLFYDWREGWNNGSGINGKGKIVQAVQIDIGKFNAWLFGTNWFNGSTNVNGGQYCNATCLSSSHKSHPIDCIYVYNSVPLTSTTLPAVRVVGGGMMPSRTAPYGFTVATAMPLYVLGHYNASNSVGSSVGKNSTVYTSPAGLMGDSITILSGNWKDSSTGQKPAATTTTVNAAVLAGIVRSTNSMYSGGVENFLRCLESWGSSTYLWYNGSIMVMFPSRYATNFWQQTGGYYDAPNRKWAFDTNFTQQVGLPPRTPQAKGVIRANWNAY
ncbi:MAG: hypothetical protein ABSH11_05430 [Verrucomicrobiota bacterium]|jgi:hypothetical protein